MHGILSTAIESQTPIEMIYLSKDGSITRRVIKITKLDGEKVKAYCYLRKNYRVFSLSNILSLSPLRKKFRGA